MGRFDLIPYLLEALLAVNGASLVVLIFHAWRTR